MKLIDTIELLTEILVGKKEETRSQKKTRTVNLKKKTKDYKEKEVNVFNGNSHINVN